MVRSWARPIILATARAAGERGLHRTVHAPRAIRPPFTRVRRGDGRLTRGPTRRADVELQFSDEAMALARERGGVMALDFIPPLG